MTELKKTRGKLATKLDWRDNCPANLFRLKWWKWMLTTDDGGKQWTLKKCGNRKTRLVQGSCRFHPTTCPILADFFRERTPSTSHIRLSKSRATQTEQFLCFSLLYKTNIFPYISYCRECFSHYIQRHFRDWTRVKFVPLYLGRLITWNVFYRHLGAAGITEIISCHTFFLTSNLHKFGVCSLLKRNAMFCKETCDVYTLN